MSLLGELHEFRELVYTPRGKWLHDIEELVEAVAQVV